MLIRLSGRPKKLAELTQAFPRLAVGDFLLSGLFSPKQSNGLVIAENPRHAEQARSMTVFQSSSLAALEALRRARASAQAAVHPAATFTANSRRLARPAVSSACPRSAPRRR